MPRITGSETSLRTIDGPDWDKNVCALTSLVKGGFRLSGIRDSARGTAGLPKVLCGAVGGAATVARYCLS